MFSSLLYLFIVNVAYLIAVPIENTDHNNVFRTHKNTVSIFTNEVNTPYEETNHNNDVCTDFYSFTCSKRSSEILSGYKFKENMTNIFSLFVSAAEDLLKNKIDHGIKSLSIEQILYKSCIKLSNLDSSEDDSSYDDSQESLGVEGDKDEDDFQPDEDKPLSFEDDKLFTTLLSAVDGHIKANTWQELDTNLASLGFGHAFFNIRVISDPRKPTKNIILLEPPSVKEWNSKKLTDVISDMFLNYQIGIFSYCDKKYSITTKNEKNFENEVDDESPFLKSVEKNDDESDYDEEELSDLCQIFENAQNEDFHNEIYETLLSRKDKKVIDIFNKLLMFIFDAIDVTNVKTTHHRLTIQNWNKRYNEVVTKLNAKIDWIKIFKDEFKHLGITIDDNEYIIIRNQPYFHHLAELLNEEKDLTIEKAVRVKFIAENLRYIEWGVVQQDNPVDMSSFCFEETKLYGLSEFILRSLKEKHKELHVKKAQEILNHIVSVLYSNITNSKYLSTLRKVFIKSELQSISKNIFENKWDRNEVSHFYGNGKCTTFGKRIFTGFSTQFLVPENEVQYQFTSTGNYFVDISNYKKIVRDKELSRLRESSLSIYEYSPFSINEIENPRNRFLLHTILSLIASETLFDTAITEIETLYATYGVNMASFLYSLLNEKIFESDMYYRHGIEWLVAHNTYSSQTVKCFIPTDIVDYGYPLAYETITDIFSVQIAYEAMKENSEFTSTTKFFTAYAQAQCDTKNKRLTNKVVSNFGELWKALHCPDNGTENSVCQKRLFQN